MKNKKKLIIKYPKEYVVEFAGLKFVPNSDNGSMCAIDYKPKTFSNKDGLIVQSKKRKIITLVVGSKGSNITIDTTVEELEKFVAKAKKRKKYFEALAKKSKNKNYCGMFLLHLNPELSFLFRK